jgi:hypothetical protein
MSNEDRIKLYSLITDKYEVAADEIEKEFGINVGRQLNVIPGLGFGAEGLWYPDLIGHLIKSHNFLYQ